MEELMGIEEIQAGFEEWAKGRSSDMTAEELAENECEECGDTKWPVICWSCGGDGFSYHDCGEDVCCCLHPEDNVWCDICDGKGHYPVCPTCCPDADFE